MKQQINQQEYCQILGLLLIAGQHTKSLADVKSAIAKIVEIEETSSDADWIDDAIYHPYSADELLSYMNIQKDI